MRQRQRRRPLGRRTARAVPVRADRKQVAEEEGIRKRRRNHAARTQQARRGRADMAAARKSACHLVRTCRLTRHRVLLSIPRPNRASRDRGRSGSRHMAAGPGDMRATSERDHPAAGARKQRRRQRYPARGTCSAGLDHAPTEGPNHDRRRASGKERPTPSDRVSRTSSERPGMRTICLLLIAACVPIWQGSCPNGVAEVGGRPWPTGHVPGLSARRQQGMVNQRFLFRIESHL